MKINSTLFIILPTLLLLFMPKAWSWGGRGHHSICDAATHLVENEQLRDFLKYRPQVMGHLCNVPDIYWKTLGSDVRKEGDPTHYIDPEILGISIDKISLNYKDVQKEFEGKTNQFDKSKTIFSIPLEFGSAWWRADQFYRLAIKNGLVASSAEAPKNKADEQNENLPFNQGMYSMIAMMGIMGHYVGDISQPLHNSADYDGYKSGHGGLHAYYEEAAVVHFPASLINDIVNSAKKQKKQMNFQKYKTVIEKMKAMSLQSEKDIPLVFKMDPIIKKSTESDEKGMKIRVPAERKPSRVGFEIYKDLIVKEMGRSSLLLAHLWDQIYIQSGKPKLENYKSFRYPFTPDYVPPDYMIQAEQK